MHESGKVAEDPTAQSEASGSPWSPFRFPTFTVLWVATVVSNIGTWMQNAAAGWLMATMSLDPLVVALVQVATSLPMFLFVLPAGALADIVDRRRLLLVSQISSTVAIAVLTLLVWLGKVTPGILLTFTFLAGIGAALTSPAWQAIVPQLVPRSDLHAAIALNSVGFNVSRAVGPALAGLIIAALGLASPFFLNAISYLGVIAALIWWRESGRGSGHLPAEGFTSAIRVGLRHARYNPHLRSTLIRAFGFFPFASAYWALLPLVARNQVAGGPELYGFLLGAISVGAILGALALPHIKSAIGPDRLVAAGTIGTAVALTLFGLARHQIMALLASVIAGVSWIAVLATISVSAQVALPSWVRGRGLSLLAVTMFGGLTIGSVIWGQVAAVIGLPRALFISASLAVAALPFLQQKLETGAEVDLLPSMHWPSQPFILPTSKGNRGPVLVTIEYRIDINNRNLFLAALTEFSHERRRDGAYAWRVFEDTSQPGRFLEAFMVESWEEHLRQHERVTNADKISQNEIRRYNIDGEPVVTHFIAATPE